MKRLVQAPAYRVPSAGHLEGATPPSGRLCPLIQKPALGLKT